MSKKFLIFARKSRHCNSEGQEKIKRALTNSAAINVLTAVIDSTTKVRDIVNHQLTQLMISALLLATGRAHLSIIHPHKFAFYYKQKRSQIVFIDIHPPANTPAKLTVADMVDKSKDKAIKVKGWSKRVMELNCEEPTECTFKILNAYSITDEQK